MILVHVAQVVNIKTVVESKQYQGLQRFDSGNEWEE